VGGDVRVALLLSVVLLQSGGTASMGALNKKPGWSMQKYPQCHCICALNGKILFNLGW
jgi:hypothetical protein